MNLFPYALTIAVSHTLGEPLSLVFIHAFMQVEVKPLLSIMPHLTAFHMACKHVKIVHTQYPLKLTANFFMIALPMLLTNVLLRSAVEDNSMLKDRFAVPGMMTSPLPKFGNLTNSNWFWSISLGLCMMITFCLVPLMPLVILREWPGSTFFLYSILWISPNVENFGHPRTISYTAVLLAHYSQG